MRQDVIARLVRAMREAALYALIAISPENFAYVTGFLSPTQPLMRWRHDMALVTADGQTSLVSVEMDYLPAGDFTALVELLPQAGLVPAQRLLSRLREIKTPAEIEILRRLSRIADRSITDAYRA